MVSRKELAKLKRALRKIRKEKLEQLNSELERALPKRKIERMVEEKIEKLRKDAFKGKPEQLAYESLAELCNELYKSKSRHVKLLTQILNNLNSDFLERKISTREYLRMAEPVKRELAYQKAYLAALKKTLDESTKALAIFKKLPSFIAASHKRARTKSLVSAKSICKVFEKKKVEHLKEVEKELIRLYELSDAEIAMAEIAKEPVMSLDAVEKKAKRALMLAQKHPREIHKERERERVAEIIAELRKHAKKLAS